MLYSEQMAQLSDAERKRFVDGLAELGLSEKTASELLKFKVVLEGAKFHGTVSGDLAHALWKLQLAYYRLVAFALYGDASATLSTKEKELFLLVFRIENGSTGVFEDLSDSLFKIIDRAFDKMEGWQILLAVIAMAAAYGGSKYFAYLKDKGAEEASKHKHDADCSVMKSFIEANKEIFLAAWDAGADGRKAILKNVSGLEHVVIGDREYSKEDIESIRRRATRIKAQTETKIICVAVEDINSRDKDLLVVVLHEKDTENRFKANLVLNFEEEADLATALDMIWNSARYPEHFFWAEVSIVSRHDKIASVSILNVAKNREDLEDQDPEEI